MGMKNTNISRLLAIIGFFAFGYGAGLIYVHQAFSVAGTVLVCAGLIGLCFYVLQVRRRLTHYKRRLQIKCVLFYTFVIFCSGAVFFLTNYYAFQSNVRWDLTRYKQHTLSSSTVEIIENLDRKINLTALVVGAPPKYLEDLLNEYERLGEGQIKTKIIDPLVDLGYAAQFGNVISGNEKKLIVESFGENPQREDINFTSEPLNQEHVNNGILRTIQAPGNVYFLSGHGEFELDNTDDTGLSYFVQVLATNNVNAHTLILGNDGAIPDDCDLLVIPGPKQHLLESEERIIQDYMLRGGDVWFMVEHSIVTTPDKPLTEEEILLNPSLNSILNRWGLKVYPDVVVDLKSYVGKDVGSPATRNYLTHRAIVSGLDYTFYVRPRSIEQTGHRRESIKLAPLVLTSSAQSSWGESNRTLQVKYEEGFDQKGPVPIAYVGWEPRDESKTSDTRFIVFTDADFITNIYIDQFSNAQMGLNVVNWLMERDYQKFSDIEKIKVEPLELTSTDQRIIIAILVFIPLMILFLGLSVWLQSIATRS